MTLKGDLSTLDLADLLQNLEQHKRSGLLSVESDNGWTKMYVCEGKLTLLATEERPTLMDILVRSEAVSSEDFEKARKRRRKSRKSLIGTLIEMELIDREAITQLVRERLLGDACEVVAAVSRSFTFEEGNVPRGAFDPEERSLGIELSIRPMLLEAARRADHWQRIRLNIPSDSTHYRTEPRRKAPLQFEGDKIVGELLRLLDGTRSVAEVMVSFLHSKFEAYERLSELVQTRTVQAIGAHELANLALELAAHDLDRAWEVVEHGFAMYSQHTALLEAQVFLAERRGVPEMAIEGLKILAHQHKGAGEFQAARKLLDRARELDPSDLALWQRSLDLAISDGRTDDALELGRELAELYRAPGLHKKACLVFETLLNIRADAWELHREHARSLADCGELEQAVDNLDSYAQACLGREELKLACAAFREILALDPSSKDAETALNGIESGAYQRMLKRRRRLIRRLLLMVAVGLFLGWFLWENTARKAYRSALETIGRAEMIEARRYAEAAQILYEVGEEFPFTTTAFLDVPQQVALWRSKVSESKSVWVRSTDSPD